MQSSHNRIASSTLVVPFTAQLDRHDVRVPDDAQRADRRVSARSTMRSGQVGVRLPNFPEHQRVGQLRSGETKRVRPHRGAR